MADIIQLRRDTEANWIFNNPILNDGEIGVAFNCATLPSTKFKMGNGIANWNDIDYFNDVSIYASQALLYSQSANNSAMAAASSETNAFNSKESALASAETALINAQITVEYAEYAEETRLSILNLQAVLGNVEGGSANSIYSITQIIDGGDSIG